MSSYLNTLGHLYVVGFLCRHSRLPPGVRKGVRTAIVYGRILLSLLEGRQIFRVMEDEECTEDGTSLFVVPDMNRILMNMWENDEILRSLGSLHKEQDAILITWNEPGDLGWNDLTAAGREYRKGMMADEPDPDYPDRLMGGILRNMGVQIEL